MLLSKFVTTEKKEAQYCLQEGSQQVLLQLHGAMQAFENSLLTQLLKGLCKLEPCADLSLQIPEVTVPERVTYRAKFARVSAKVYRSRKPVYLNAGGVLVQSSSQKGGHSV